MHYLIRTKADDGSYIYYQHCYTKGNEFVTVWSKNVSEGFPFSNREAVDSFKNQYPVVTGRIIKIKG